MTEFRDLMEYWESCWRFTELTAFDEKNPRPRRGTDVDEKVIMLEFIDKFRLLRLQT
jgi:hypothetical protein